MNHRLVSKSRFWVTGFGFRFPGSGVRIAGFSFRSCGCGLRDSGFGIWGCLRLVALPRGRLGARVLVREKPARNCVPWFMFRVENQSIRLEISGSGFCISGSRP